MSFRTAALILVAILVSAGLVTAGPASASARGAAPAHARTGAHRCVCVHRARLAHRRRVHAIRTARAGLAEFAASDRRWAQSWEDDWATGRAEHQRSHHVRAAYVRPWDADRAGYLTWPGKTPVAGPAPASDPPGPGPGAPSLDRY